MKNFTLDDIKKMVEQSLKEEPTGDDWLDSRYNEQTHWIGHTNPYYKLFYYLAEFLQPELVVELGSWQATGAAHFAAGNPNGMVITCDIHKDDKNAQLRTIEAAGHYENLTYLNRWTVDKIGQDATGQQAVGAVSFIENLPNKINILYIDAWHNYKYVKWEWEAYLPLLASPALVIFDDVTNDYNFERMTEFWEELPEPKYLSKDGLHKEIPMGFVIVNEPLIQTIERVATTPMFDIVEVEKITKGITENVAEDRGTDSVKSTRTSKRGRPSKKS